MAQIPSSVPNAFPDPRRSRWKVWVEQYGDSMFAVRDGEGPRPTRSEDLVQETLNPAAIEGQRRFQTNPTCRLGCFPILRRKIVDHYRGQPAAKKLSQLNGDGALRGRCRLIHGNRLA